MFFNGTFHMSVPVLADQQGQIYISSMRTLFERPAGSDGW